MAVASHRLNLLAAFFLPIATLTAIFGMNLRHGLEGKTSASLAPFAAVLGIGLLAGILLMAFITQRGKKNDV
jgi:Mg2+ and Co2+ transporter CorA